MSTTDIELIELAHNIETQDGLATEHPFYAVYDLVSVPVDDRITNTEFKIVDGWLDEECDFYENYGGTAERYQALTTLANGADSVTINGERYENKYVMKIPVFITACFTRVGAENYLKANGHNLNQPYIYVHSLNRNQEMIGLRKFINTFAFKDQ